MINNKDVLPDPEFPRIDIFEPVFIVKLKFLNKYFLFNLRLILFALNITSLLLL